MNEQWGSGIVKLNIIAEEIIQRDFEMKERKWKGVSEEFFSARQHHQEYKNHLDLWCTKYGKPTEDKNMQKGFCTAEKNVIFFFLD